MIFTCHLWKTTLKDSRVEKIFIYIASCKEPHLVQTIKSALANANEPDRLYFSIFNTVLSDEDYITDEEIVGMPPEKLFLVEAISPEILGIGMSRMIASLLQNVEADYALQVDAHMIFDKGWDDQLIKNLKKAEELSEKAVITCLPVPWSESPKDPSLCLMYGKYKIDPYNFDSNSEKLINQIGFKLFNYIPGIVNFPGNSWIPEILVAKDRSWSDSSDYIEVNGIHASYMFFRFSNIREVLHDPQNMFEGDQLNYTFRLLSRGYKLYAFKKPIIMAKDKFDFEGELLNKKYDWRYTNRRKLIHFYDPYQKQIQDKIFNGKDYGYWGAPNREGLVEAKNKMGVWDYYPE